MEHMAASLEHIKGFRCTTWRSNSLWSFIIKLTNHILPTLDVLQTRYDTLYKNWNCPSCHKESETLEHLITCDALAPQWLKVNKCIRDYVNYFVNKTDTCAKLGMILNNLEISTTQPAYVLEWLTGLITPGTFTDFKNIFNTNNLTNSFLIDIINISRLAFKYIVWTQRNTNMKALECSKNINLKKTAMASKRKSGTTLSRPNSQHTLRPSTVLKMAWERELRAAELAVINDDNYRAIDDISPVQYTNALITFIRAASPRKHSLIRKSWANDLWLHDTALLIKGIATNCWSFNKNSALAQLGKRAGKIWSWWDSWWDSNSLNEGIKEDGNIRSLITLSQEYKDGSNGMGVKST